MINWKKVKWFIERTVFIVDKKTQEVRFVFNRVQSKFFDKASFTFDIVLKARQEGMSALISILFLVVCICFKNQRAVIISHEGKSTERLFRRVDWWVKRLRSIGFKIVTDKANKGEFTFPGTESWFYCGTAGTKAFGRGDNHTLQHISELAFWEHPEIITGILEARYETCWTIIESTANGMGNLFHQLCEDARFNRNRWRFHFFAWYDNPEYSVKFKGEKEKAEFDTSLTDEDRRYQQKYKLSLEQMYWRDRKLKEMAEPNLFPQEYPSNPDEAFIASGRFAFDIYALNVMDKKVREPKIRGYILEESGEFKLREKDDDPLYIWKPREEDRAYAIFADVAEGVLGGAYSDAIVIDIGSWESVSWYHAHIEPIAYAKVLRRMGLYYNEALICPEFNNHGNATVGWLFENGYKNLYKQEGKDGDSYVDYGWRTQGKLDELMYSFLREDIRNLKYSIPIAEVIYQLKCSVINEKGKLEVNSGFKDSVVCMGMASAVLNKLPHEDVTATKTFKEKLNRHRSRRHIGHGFRSKNTYSGT